MGQIDCLFRLLVCFSTVLASIVHFVVHISLRMAATMVPASRVEADFHRVTKEIGERLGRSVAYLVR